MIYPISLYNFGKVCRDSQMAGNVLRALCKQDVELTPAEQTMLEMIRNDNEWMDERVSAKREKERARKAEYRKSQVSQDVPGTTRDKADETDVPHPTYLPSSLPSSLPTSKTNTYRSDTDPVRLAKAASGSDRVKINPYSMGGDEFFSMKWTALQLCQAALGDGFWAKAILQLGDAVVLEELWTFISEVKAGEAVDNPGAVMTKRLKAKGVK